jgi:hypothetical protein
MPEYRVFAVDEAGHISRPPRAFYCTDDQAAIKQAQQFVGLQNVELWDHDRFVGLIGPDGLKPTPPSR